MSVFKGKRILLGVTGGIAAYKTAYLVRAFIKEGAAVKVVMTPSAQRFITPLTLAVLSKNPVSIDFVKTESHAVDWNNHVELALWADFMIVAPATARTLSKMAAGDADNLLLAVYLSCKCPVFIAPAMDLDMLKHPAVASNLSLLSSYDNHIIPAETGELASGLHGEGRMAEPENIVKFIGAHFSSGQALQGKTVLISAGPTREAIDPVRFIGNRSSGKMGFELAKAALSTGARVILVSGPTALDLEAERLTLISVSSTQEMFDALQKHAPEADILIMAAAPADYRPETAASQKIKKTKDVVDLKLVPTIDILAALGREKRRGQFFVGFALETENAIENASKKLHAKNLDAIVVNSLEDKGAGFEVDTNQITILDRTGKSYPYPLQSKAAAAAAIIKYIEETAVAH